MITGRIDWFGGRNNRTQKINDFGFIIPFNGENSESIYVHRDEIPVHLQYIIEEKGGKGVYVQFEIDTNSNRAIRVQLMAFIGTVEWSSKGMWRIDCEGRYSIYFKSNSYFRSQDIITFGLKYISKNVDEAILIKNIDDCAENKEIIDQCINSSKFVIFRKFFIKYLLSLSVDCAVYFAIGKLKYLKDAEKSILIKEILDNSVNIMIMSSELRAYLKLEEHNLNSYGYFINKSLNSGDNALKQVLLNELIENLERANNHERNIYWNQVTYLQENLKYKSVFWNIAPIDKKKQIIKEKFKTFFEIIENFNNSDYPHAQYISFAWRELYKLDEIDKNLISKWDANVFHNPFKATQMISARGAEKLVIKFYEALGFVVEDISSHQVTQKSQGWKKADIRLDSTDLLDVKNARKSVNSDVYSEFCIPSFKQFRDNDIKIVGVFSPYLQKEYIDEIKKATFYVNNPSVLGDFNKTKLKELEYIFSNRLISIDISRACDPKTYLPHWVFDYNERFYVKQLELVANFEELHDYDIPTWDDILLVGNNNPLPLFIAARRKLPQDWLDSLPQWQATFVNYLIALPIEHLFLPYLFLSLITHFVSMLSDDGSNYSPQKYQEILYISSEKNRPLKLYDPLNTIKDLCDTLQSLWEHRDKANLAEFKIFKFNGRGLLQGKRSESDSNLTTILAYCGGWVEKKGKCGYTPLVIGKHENCLTCGRLICPKENCCYCSDKCLSYSERKQGHQY